MIIQFLKILVVIIIVSLFTFPILGHGYIHNEKGEEFQFFKQIKALKPVEKVGTVQLLKNEQREQAATEEINVPNGVQVKIKRSRTIRRTIRVNWQAARTIDLSISIKSFIKTAIQQEIKQIMGEEYQQGETIQYEVTLNGDKSNKYRLVWIDIWRQGVIEILEDEKTNFIPFRIREKTELQVNEI